MSCKNAICSCWVAVCVTDNKLAIQILAFNILFTDLNSSPSFNLGSFYDVKKKISLEMVLFLEHAIT